MSQRHILVTGGAGFIGSHLVDRLLSLGHRVTAYDDLSTGTRANLASALQNPNFTLVVGDITEGITLNTPPDQIVHLAAQISVMASLDDPYTDLKTNLTATLQLIDYAKQVGAKHLVFASSAATYGEGPQPAEERTRPQPTSPYGIHKLASEYHLHVASESGLLPTTSLRFFNVYGPRQNPQNAYAGVISIFTHQALAGETLRLFGAGLSTRDFVYVLDVVDAIVRTLDSDSPPVGPLNVGTGCATSVRTLAETIVRLTLSPSKLEEAPPRPGEMQSSRANVKLIKKLLGWKATTPLEEGLRATVTWMAELRAQPSQAPE